jgi:hypothetical protein
MRRERKTVWGVLWNEEPDRRWALARSLARSHYYIALHRLENRYRDARAYLAGACNATTWDPAKRDYQGGYSHWRCGKRRGHHLEVPRGVTLETGDYGPHRFANYIWEGPGHRVEYAPLPICNADNSGWFDSRTVIPFYKQAQNRRITDTRRRSRQRARAYEETTEIRRAIREAEAHGS